MKYIKFALFFACSLPFLVAGQTGDKTVVIQEVDSLIQVARSLTNERNFDRALEVVNTAGKIVLDSLGQESAAYGNICFNHGRIFHISGDTEKALKWYLKSKIILEKALGVWHIEYASCLNNLAVLYKSIGNYVEAEPLYLETISIREKALGKNDPSYGRSIQNLAIFYSDLSRYEEAKSLYLQAKSIYMENYGKEHFQYARCLNGLAALYMETGLYEKAEKFYLETIDIQHKILGDDDPDFGISLNNLANLYFVMSNYNKAEPLYLQAKKIWENKLGKEDPLYALCIENLATLYMYTCQYDQSEKNYLEVLDIHEKKLGKENSEYANTLKNLAGLYKVEGNFSKAGPLYQQAKIIYENSLGKEHPDYAICINNLGDLYFTIGDYKEAEPLIMEAYNIWKKVYGQQHPEYISGLQGLADIYTGMGKKEQAAPYFIEVSDLQKTLLTNGIHHLSEQELNKYQTEFLKSQAKLLSFAYQSNMETSPIEGTCYDDVLFYKGFLLNASSKVKNMALSDEAAAKKYNLLKSYKRRLSAEYSKPLAERQNVDELETKTNDLEKEITRLVAGFDDARQQVNWQQVRNNLQPGEAALEFIHFPYFHKKQTNSILYAALLIRKEDEQPLFISLFEEKQLDSLLHTKSGRKADYVNRLYAVTERGAKPIGEPQKSLYELIWQPMEIELEGIGTIYYAPSGLLHRLNIGAIPVSDEETLADLYSLVELGSTRQMVNPSNTPITNQQAILFGGVQYEMDSTAIEKANSKLNGETLADRGAIPFYQTDTTSRGDNWKFLKWTEKEVMALETILSENGLTPISRMGYDATEESFKDIGYPGHSPRILHVATHGFFFPDPAGEKGENGNGMEPVFKTSDHPMIRSGLILAGGNYTWLNGKPFDPNMEDGILTAYEISQMDLSNTELVVLSACETGLGDIEGNEGVYGLQRAFKIAGAKYLIMSLWQIPDFQTQELMTTFYEKWVAEKRSIPNAFRLAQKEMREKYRNPYFWAGFVLVE